MKAISCSTFPISIFSVFAGAVVSGDEVVRAGVVVLEEVVPGVVVPGISSVSVAGAGSVPDAVVTAGVDVVMGAVVSITSPLVHAVRRSIREASKRAKTFFIINSFQNYFSACFLYID